MSYLFAVAAVWLLINVVQTAPERNLTALKTEYAPPFIPEPDGRGTWSLLYSCVFTLVLCVWTAIHPNLPDPGAPEIRKYRFKGLWVVWAIFAPEIRVWTAFKQYRRATSFISELSRLRDEHTLRTRKNSDADPRDLEGQRSADTNRPELADTDVIPPMPPFTKAYGFYVLMGGLAVNVVHLHDYLQDVVLTPNGILELARKGHFFHVSDAYINDKSKANLLAKGLVLLQITWTVMQCLSRKVAGLPLSILEVHTLVHAGCALIIYALWFNKPFDVDQPVMVQHGIPDEIAALMLVRNYKFGMYPVGNLLPPSGFRRAKRSGSRYGIWLSGLASESTYLVYNPNLGEGSGSTNLSLYSANGPEQGISNSHVGFTIQSAVIKNKSTAKDASTETQPEDLEQPSAVDSAGILPRTIDSLRPGVKIDTTLSTGDFLTGGIGPNAYAIGEWDDALRARPPHTQPSRVKPIPEGLRDKLPLHQVDHSSVKYYCSMNISLSPKDVRRWQLAGAALRKELPITLSPQKEKPLLNFESSGGSFRGAYFYISQGLFGRTKGNKGGVVEGSWRDPHNFQAHVEAWQRVYHNCLNFEVLNLGSTSAVTMLPGLLYGVFHLALWNYVFPSQAERLMWRMSGIVLIAVPVLLAVALMLRTGFQRYTPSQVSQPPDPHLPTTTAAAAATATADYRASTTVLQEGEIDSEAAVSAADIRENDGGGVQQGDTAGMNIPLPQALLLEAAAYLTVLTGALYVFSRFFIIVESFISLRHVPVGVYTDVGWSKYIPHF